MPVITNGPILAGFKAVLEAARRPLALDTEECSASVVRLLERHQTVQRPGMLLGKVQSGKTRAFVGAIAIAFDSGFDIAVVLTKTSTPLAVQTLRRLQHDLAPVITDRRLVLTFDAAARIGALNGWEQSRKLIFVAKKHPKNLEHLNRALLDDHPALRTKRVLVIDDEADFASVGYERRQGVLQVRRIQSLINDLRTGLPNAVYLEVTATPYSLYLQPADIETPATGQQYRAVRPAFTKRVPPHSGYIGGEFYFDRAREIGHVASFVHVPVPDLELTWMRQPSPIPDDELLTTPDLQALRRSIITFILGGVMRQQDETGPRSLERLFSFIMHLERLRGAHADHQALAQRLIDRLRTANLVAEPVASQIRAAYDDLKGSRRAGGLSTPTLATIHSHIGLAFESITPEVVNSDTQLYRLLDDSGQLRQRSPFNIYIGGQSLDRGVTIANVIGFYYGRDPRVAQQDTTIQHCRMYGDRPEADLTVTRFYTSNGIYDRMRRMHEFDQMLWAQLTAQEVDGESVDNPGDVLFLQRDPTGQIRHCSPSKIAITQVQWVSPDGELVPHPFSTRSDSTNPNQVQQIITRLQALAPRSRTFEMTVDEACELLNEVCSLIRIDDGWNWDLEALVDAVRYLAARNPNPDQIDRVVAIYTLNNRARKWKDPAQTQPQNAPYAASTEDPLREAARNSPALALYHNIGEVDRGWSGSPFIWPVLFVPDGVVPAVFSNNRRSAPRRRQQD